MSIKVDWAADPEQIRRTAPIPSILKGRDYAFLGALFALILVGAALAH